MRGSLVRLQSDVNGYRSATQAEVADWHRVNTGLDSAGESLVCPGVTGVTLAAGSVVTVVRTRASNPMTWGGPQNHAVVRDGNGRVVTIHRSALGLGR